MENFSGLLTIILASMIGSNTYFFTVTYLYGPQTYDTSYFGGKLLFFTIALVCVFLYRKVVVW